MLAKGRVLLLDDALVRCWHTLSIHRLDEDRRLQTSLLRACAPCSLRCVHQKHRRMWSVKKVRKLSYTKRKYLQLGYFYEEWCQWVNIGNSDHLRSKRSNIDTIYSIIWPVGYEHFLSMYVLLEIGPVQFVRVIMGQGRFMVYGECYRSTNSEERQLLSPSNWILWRGDITTSPCQTTG